MNRNGGSLCPQDPNLGHLGHLPKETSTVCIPLHHVSILPATLSSVGAQGSLGAMMEWPLSCGDAGFYGEWALWAMALGLGPPPRW